MNGLLSQAIFCHGFPIKQCLIENTIWLCDRYIDLAIGQIGYLYRQYKSEIQTALKGNAFPGKMGAVVLAKIVSSILIPRG
jgi:hypothetical protein